MNSRRIVGKPLRFNKGDWLVGAKDAQAELPAGTTLAVVMPTLLAGWIKWLNGDVVDDNVGVVAEGFKMPRRRELGDEDSDQWPFDEKAGERKDPWQKTSSIIMIDRSLSGVYTFTTNSAGGLEAISQLCGEYDEHLRERGAGRYPSVALEAGSYAHRDRTIGRVKHPILRVVEFVDAAPFDAKLAVVAGRAVRGPEEPPNAGARRLDPPSYINDAPPIDENAYGGGVIDDDIPF
jgi:hypothetical protein